MATKSSVDQFISQESLAVVGVSRNSTKFGNAIYQTLKKNGHKVYPINANAEQIQGDTCYPSLSALPVKVGGVVIVVSPDKTEGIVKEAIDLGIKNIWMQQGAESAAAIQYCQEKQVNLIHGECVLMFDKPAFPHTIHRWIWGLIGKLPK